MGNAKDRPSKPLLLPKRAALLIPPLPHSSDVPHLLLDTGLHVHEAALAEGAKGSHFVLEAEQLLLGMKTQS